MVTSHCLYFVYFSTYLGLVLGSRYKRSLSLAGPVNLLLLLSFYLLLQIND